jgi:hypothetical protein
MDNADEFFTWASFAQVGGCTLGVAVAATVIGQLFKSATPWIPFVLALLISVISAGASGAIANPFGQAVGSPAFFKEFGDWVIVVLNACLLFCGALGLNDVGRSATTRSPVPEGQRQSYRQRPRPRLFEPWL